MHLDGLTEEALERMLVELSLELSLSVLLLECDEKFPGATGPEESSG